MPIGPGRYDDLCTYVREQAQSEFAVVIVGGGNRGSGFSVQTNDPNVAEWLPGILDVLARQIRGDVPRVV